MGDTEDRHINENSADKILAREFRNKTYGFIPIYTPQKRITFNEAMDRVRKFFTQIITVNSKL